MDVLFLNAQERCVLAGLSHFCQSLYTLGLKPYLDYQDGTVGGEKRRISLQALREVLYVEPGRGLQNTGHPSRDQIRRGLETLVRCGLLARIPDALHYVYRFVLVTEADLKLLAKIRFGLKEAQESSANLSQTSHDAAPPSKPVTTGDSADFTVSDNLQENLKAATPLKEINKNKKNIHADFWGGNSKSLPLPIAADFTPTTVTLTAAKRLGLTEEQIAIERELFIQHNQCAQNTSLNWQQFFLGWLSRHVQKKQTLQAQKSPRFKATVDNYRAPRSQVVTPYAAVNSTNIPPGATMVVVQQGAAENIPPSGLQAEVLQHATEFSQLSLEEQREQLRKSGLSRLAKTWGQQKTSTSSILTGAHCHA